MDSKNNNNEHPVNSVKTVVWEAFLLWIWTMYYYAEAIFRVFVKPTPKSLTGETVLVTGGANGIGKQVCLHLAKNRAKLIIWDVDDKSAKSLVKELKLIGCDAYSYKVDVSERSQVEAAALKVQEEVGDVTVLVNNAGIMPCKTFFKHSPEELERIFKINVFGNYWTLRAFVPKMMEMNKGHVVTICSAAGLIGTRNLVPYCGSKHAIQGTIEGLKDEFRSMKVPPNIKFTTVYPFSCGTDLLKGVRSRSRFHWLIPEVLRPEYVAATIVEGLRLNYEHVYVPGFVQLAGTTAKAFPPKAQYAAADFFQCRVEPIS